jgi:cation diffusion facilitator CzcD-associated flavoprotein CzcO
MQSSETQAASLASGIEGAQNGAPVEVTNGLENGVHLDKEPYQIKQQWFGKKSHIKIIGLGSGIGGLALAYKLPRMLTNYTLTIYEKTSKMSGTWWENTYPGVACDVPAHIYTYSFQGNPDWSTFYAYGPEIYQYYKKVAEDRNLTKDIVFDRDVISITWDDLKGIWNVTLKDPRTNELSYDWCHVFLNTGGRLNKWKMPEIAGLDLFRGPVTHSAHWDHGIDFKDKTVAIIGTGSSAIQITPQLQKMSKKLVCFMRSETWIAPPIASQIAMAAKAEGTDKSEEDDVINGKATTDISQAQFKFTEAQKKRFRENPAYHLEFRRKLESSINMGSDMFIMGTETQKTAMIAFREEMLKRIGPGFEELKKKIIPTWSPGEIPKFVFECYQRVLIPYRMSPAYSR